MQQHNIFGPRPLGPWGGTKKSNIIKSQLLKLIFKIFKPNFVCLLTNERYKTYQTELSFDHLGHAPGVGLGGTVWGCRDSVWPDVREFSVQFGQFVRDDFRKRTLYGNAQ